jgi:hypothetical protein
LRAHINVAANRIANFLSSLIGDSALDCTEESGTTAYHWSKSLATGWVQFD